MLIQRLKKWWIENPSFLTCEERSGWIFQSTIYEVIGLSQSDKKQKRVQGSFDLLQHFDLQFFSV